MGNSHQILSSALVLLILNGCGGGRNYEPDPAAAGETSVGEAVGGNTTRSSGGTKGDNRTSHPEAGASIGGSVTSQAGGTSGTSTTDLGGAAAIGGGMTTGGALAFGGSVSLGGKTSSGGTSSFGGSVSLGGKTSSGGTSSFGGTVSLGGKTSLGGTSSFGGAVSLGGKTSSGGASSTEPLVCSGDTSGNGWDGCRGTGCDVCVEKLAGYPLYFTHHRNCIPNATCDGKYYTCSSNCPAPTSLDINGGPECSGAANGWSGCRGNGCMVCKELIATYPNYTKNHPDCAVNDTCAGSYFACSALCPAPTALDK